jgi:methylated-DNA-[protein]-cysteine S-methyltransferase
MNGSLIVGTPLGLMTLTERDGALIAAEFGALAPNVPSPLLRRAGLELGEYFAGTRRSFTLPLSPQGTDFQRAVWAALLEIPYGETRSYGEIARAVGKPGAARAVGMANNRNPLPVFIPCHRVIGADGALVGYGGGLEKKRFLLALEK